MRRGKIFVVSIKTSWKTKDLNHTQVFGSLLLPESIKPNGNQTLKE